MKKHILIIATLILIFTFSLSAQDSTKVEKNDKTLLYTIGYNRVPDGFNFPLFGVFNVAKGDHTGLQIGFSNRNSGNFRGLEVGFANAVGREMTGSQIAFFNAVGNQSTGLTVGFFNAVGNISSGSQIGFFNAVGNKMNGLNVGFFNAIGNMMNGTQIGFLNTTGNKVQGIQVGFTNILGNKFEGFQTGFVNVLGNEFNGGQVGFVNVIGNKINGVQIGFVNIDGNAVTGLQVGFLNKLYHLSGVQVGFINLVDTVSTGIPIGFFTLVKHGGFQAIELGTSTMYPFNISYKTGVKQFYTTIMASYGFDSFHPMAVGAGFGTFIPFNSTLSFNPELISQTTLFHSWNQLTSMNLNLNYDFSSHFSVVGGPSIVWNHIYQNTPFIESVYSIYYNQLDSYNKLLIGLNASIRYRF